MLGRQVAEPALQLQVLEDQVLLLGDEVVVGPRLGVVLVNGIEGLVSEPWRGSGPRSYQAVTIDFLALFW